MAIDINGNCVVFNGKELCSTPAGAGYVGVICHQGFCDTRLFQGTLSGYMAGGIPAPAGDTTIQKFPFASSSTSTDVGELTAGVYENTDGASASHGYSVGGNQSRIDKFPFTSDTSATNIGSLSVPRNFGVAGQSAIQYGNAYASGGSVGPVNCNTIEKYPFSSDSNATDIADLSQARDSTGGHSSITDGYTAGGITPPGSATDVIDKFPFAADANAANVGELSPGTSGGYYVRTTSGPDFGYVNMSPTPARRNIYKYPFASGNPTSTVGVLSAPKAHRSGHASTTDGFFSGGSSPISSDIEKFPFSSDTNAVDAGELFFGHFRAMGTQV